MTRSESTARAFKAILAVLAAALIATAFAFAARAWATEDGQAAAQAEGAGSEDAETGGVGGSWHDWNPDPGDTVNISDANWNTTITFSKPGTYRLTGSSTNVCVVVDPGQGEEITLMLADGLRIDPGISANVGVRASAIEIVERDEATVRLVSEAGASSYFGSYLLAPAIRKSGTQTQLVFETANSSNPGTITARSSNTSLSAGIGTVPYAALSNPAPAGNMVFSSGKVVAEGGLGGAGIGGGNNCGAKLISITGGEVIATGGGAGIGGGAGGGASNITISGGTITATGSGGAGIGSGSMASNRNKSFADWISISGGTVTATSTYENGSGIGAGDFLVRTDYIYVYGGTVTAKGGNGEHSAGIGGGHPDTYDAPSSGVTSIKIYGGVIDAEGSAVGIGTVSDKGDAGLTSISIYGGTIKANGMYSNVDIGDATHSSSGTVMICGGSIDCDSIAGWVTDSQACEIRRTVVQLEGADEGVRVTSLDVSRASGAGLHRPFGANDVLTSEDGKLYLWICSKSTVVGATDENLEVYSGRIHGVRDREGVLHKRPGIVLDKNGGNANGSANAVSLAGSLDILSAPTGPDGWTIGGYGTTPNPTDEGARKVANADGSLLINVDGYTDENGRWIYQKTSSDQLRLYTWWYKPHYYVAYNANVPDTASTQASGRMTAQNVAVDATFNLKENGYSLPGYTFAGWNTAADGSGTDYAAGQEVSNLATDDGATVVLYAQWKPLGYEVTLRIEDPDSGSASIQTIDAKFDQQFALSWNGAVPGGGAIVGWSGRALGSFYPDGTSVANLCTLNEDGTITGGAAFDAVVAQEGCAYLSVTNDGNGVSLDPSAITLTQEGGATFAGQFSASGTPGLYIAQGAAKGTYTVSIIDWDTRGKAIEIDSAGNGTLSLEYFTVTAAADDNASAWIVDPADPGARVGSVEKRMAGDTVTIGASADEGYAFESWTAGGIAPTWGGDPSQASQTVTLNGAVSLEAHAAANVYHVKFEANGGAGTMETQDMVYGEPQELFANAFSRDGYDFAGWTTTPEWTGTLYADLQEVQNLTSEDGGMVTLYAQWSPWPYEVLFLPNGAGGEAAMPPQVIYHDAETELAPNEFTWADHGFLGWNTEADGSGQWYADGETVANLSVERWGQVVLYAQWEHDSYTVEYNANGGTGEMEPQTVLTNFGEILRSCTFSREGYEFAGWSTTPDGSGTTYQPGEQIWDDLAEAGETVTLYAQWNEIPGPSPDPDPNPDPSPDPDQGNGNGSDDPGAAKPLPRAGDAAVPLAAAVAAAAIAAGAGAVGAWRKKRDA